MEGYLPTPVTNFELVDVHTADLEMIRPGEINPSSVYPDDLVSPLLDYTLKDQPASVQDQTNLSRPGWESCRYLLCE